MALKLKKKDPYGEHLVSSPATATTSVTKKVAGGEEKDIVNTSEQVHPGIIAPADELCQITVEGSHTLNLGNYESARIGVSLRVPSAKADLNETYEWATNWVSEKMQAAIAEAKGD